MKTILNFFLNIFNADYKNEYIGLSGLKKPAVRKTEIKKETSTLEKTSLTGLLKRAG